MGDRVVKEEVGSGASRFFAGFNVKENQRLLRKRLNEEKEEAERRKKKNKEQNIVEDDVVMERFDVEESDERSREGEIGEIDEIENDGDHLSEHEWLKNGIDNFQNAEEEDAWLYGNINMTDGNCLRPPRFDETPHFIDDRRRILEEDNEVATSDNQEKGIDNGLSLGPPTFDYRDLIVGRGERTIRGRGEISRREVEVEEEEQIDEDWDYGGVDEMEYVDEMIEEDDEYREEDANVNGEYNDGDEMEYVNERIEEDYEHREEDADVAGDYNDDDETEQGYEVIGEDDEQKEEDAEVAEPTRSELRNGEQIKDCHPQNLLYHFNRSCYIENPSANDIYSDLWYFSMHQNDVKSVLSYYSPSANKRRTLITTQEKLTTASPLSWLVSQKKMPLIIFKNQLYRPEEETAGGDVTARCTYIDPLEIIGKCPGSVRCNWTTGEVKQHGKCKHGSRRDHIAVELVVRKACIDHLKGTSKEKLYDQAVIEASKFNVTDLLPSNDTFAKRLGRRNNLLPARGFPPNFNFNSIEGVTCLLDTSGNFRTGSPVILVWKNDRANKYLNPSTKVIHLDGKFSGIPSSFAQLFVVSTEDPTTRTAIPLLFALATGATEAIYETIYRVAFVQGLEPEYVYIDFETASINAAKKVWPQSKVCGCWRHWKVALHKRLIKAIGADFADSNRAKLMLRSLYTLSFAPLNKVDLYFTEITANTLSLHPNMLDYSAYLKRTYVGPNARFPVTLWNCYERVKDNKEFTNNISESIFSKYSRIFNHNSYRQLANAVFQSRNWTNRVFLELESKLPPSKRHGTEPIFKNADFLDAVKRDYRNFEDFNAAILPFMQLSKLFH